jgi:hypothetical protein
MKEMPIMKWMHTYRQLASRQGLLASSPRMPLS